MKSQGFRIWSCRRLPLAPVLHYRTAGMSQLKLYQARPRVRRNTGTDMAETTGANAPSELDIEAARWFFQNTVDIFVISRAGGITQVNPAWTALTGYPTPETIGRSIDDFVWPGDEQIVNDLITILDNRGEGEAELRIRCKDGDHRWVRA